MYPEGKVTRRGESSSYAETRINIDQIKHEMRSKNMSILDRKMEGPKIPNRLASLQKTMNKQSSVAEVIGEAEYQKELAYARLERMKMVGSIAVTQKNSLNSLVNPKLLSSKEGSYMSIPAQNKQGSLGGYFGAFGYGNRDDVKILKGTGNSAFATATQGQIKSHKQNQVAMK